MVAASVGMYRSGSTLVYNIIKALVVNAGLGYSLGYPSIKDLDVKEIIVCKFHALDPKWDISGGDFWRKCYYVYTFRDIWDVLASFCSWRNMTLDNFGFQGHTATSMINWLLELDKKWRTASNLLLINYKDYYPYEKDQIIQLARKIASFLNIHPSLEVQEEIATKFNFTAMKAIADCLDEGDKHNLLNPKHLHDGKIGKWHVSFSKEEQKRFFESNSDLMKWVEDYGF